MLSASGEVFTVISSRAVVWVSTSGSATAPAAKACLLVAPTNMGVTAPARARCASA